MRVLRVVALLISLMPTVCVAQTDRQRVDLNVAIFAYLPDASTAIKMIEERFERRYPGIDLDLELWNPYDDSFEEDGLSQIVNFDIVEIDSCRIDELMAGKFGGIDKIPVEVRVAPDSLVGPARTIASTEIGEYLIPHWVCGNFLVFWKQNAAVANATSFKELLQVVGPDKNRPVHAVMWGKTGLGEFYADYMIDTKGGATARKHLINLNSGTDPVDATARDTVVELAKRLSADNRANLEHFSNHSYVLPRRFASDQNSVLLGYSERLYYTEREKQITPGNSPPQLSDMSICVKQFSFSDVSKGTPTWTDGFIVPRGRSVAKRAAIAAFLQYIQTEDAYLAFTEPAPYLAPSYLLPATEASYAPKSPIVKKQPLLPKFKAALDGSFPVSDSETWQGMRKAGAAIRTLLQP